MTGIPKGNWGLRLLALVLAIVIYFAIKNESSQLNSHHDRSLFQSR